MPRYEPCQAGDAVLVHGARAEGQTLSYRDGRARAEQYPARVQQINCYRRISGRPATMEDQVSSAMLHSSERQVAVVTIAGAPEVDRAIARLFLAFSADPVARWMYDDPYQYLLHIPRLFRALGAISYEAGAAQRTSDGLGVAIWLPPEVRGDDGARLRWFLQK